TTNWLALSFVAPPKDGVAEKEPSAAVLTTARRRAASPPGGIGSPFRRAVTTTSTAVPAARLVVPSTVARPDTKSNRAETVPDRTVWELSVRTKPLMPTGV